VKGGFSFLKKKSSILKLLGNILFSKVPPSPLFFVFLGANFEEKNLHFGEKKILKKSSYSTVSISVRIF